MRLVVKFFHPFNFVGFRRPGANSFDDLYRYGFSLDLTIECYFYRYDWGCGLNLRLLGFGFELARINM